MFYIWGKNRVTWLSLAFLSFDKPPFLKIPFKFWWTHLGTTDFSSPSKYAEVKCTCWRNVWLRQRLIGEGILVLAVHAAYSVILKLELECENNKKIPVLLLAVMWQKQQKPTEPTVFPVRSSNVTPSSISSKLCLFQESFGLLHRKKTSTSVSNTLETQHPRNFTVVS